MSVSKRSYSHSNAVSKILYDSLERRVGPRAELHIFLIITVMPAVLKLNFTCSVLIKLIIQNYRLTRQIRSFSAFHILLQEGIYSMKCNSDFKVCLCRQNIADFISLQGQSRSVLRKAVEVYRSYPHHSFVQESWLVYQEK